MKYVLRTARFGAFLFITLSLIACQKRSLLDLPSPSGSAAYVTSEFPAVVKVVLPGGRGLCTGTFISPRAVLTAAHCTPANGTYTVSTAWGNFMTSQKVVMGPGVVEDPNDIAILFFSTDIADPAQGQVAAIGGSVSPGQVLRLIGYGCNSYETRRGAGLKRTGTNMVYDVNDYIEFLTPRNDSGSFRGIIGSDNRAGACFGDSGGPAATTRDDGTLEVVGVAHTGGESENDYVSDYVSLGRGDNRSFISNANRTYNLGIDI